MFVTAFDLPNWKIFYIVLHDFCRIVVAAFYLNYVCTHNRPMVRLGVASAPIVRNHVGFHHYSLLADWQDNQHGNYAVTDRDRDVV